MVPEKVRTTPAAMATRRDILAARLIDGERKLATLKHADPRLADGIAKWQELEAEYRALCAEVPETTTHNCRDCGRPSLHGLTPCYACLAEAQ